MTKRVIRKGYVSERSQFESYVAQINAASQGWSGQPATQDALPEGLLRREYAWRKADIVSEFVVPAAVAGGYAVIGCFGGVFVARIGGLDVLNAAMLGAGLSGAGAFVMLTRNMLRSMWTIEEFGTEEIEEVPAVPKTAPKSVREVHVTLESENGRQYRFADLYVSRNPDKLIDEEQLQRLAIHCVANSKNFSRPELCRKSRILSQSEYHVLRDEMLAAGLLREAAGNAVELSPSGRALLRQFLD